MVYVSVINVLLWGDDRGRTQQRPNKDNLAKICKDSESRVELEIDLLSN